MKECIICGEKLLKPKYMQKTCSDDCRKVHHRNKYKNLYEPRWKPEERRCTICKSKFIPKAFNQKYCNSECAKKSQDINWIMENGKKSSISSNWLKLRITTFDKYGFKCHYCGRAPQTHNVVLHIDHKIPKKHGGKNIPSNLIPACSDCNLGKSDVLLEYWKKNKSN